MSMQDISLRQIVSYADGAWFRKDCTDDALTLQPAGRQFRLPQLDPVLSSPKHRDLTGLFAATSKPLD